MKSLQDWLHELPHMMANIEGKSSSAQDLSFGPVLMSLRIQWMDIQRGEFTLMNRTCLVVEMIHVEEDRQQQGWFTRVMHLLAVMSPVDFIYLERVHHLNLKRVLIHQQGWHWVGYGDQSPDLYSSPRAILGLRRN